MRFKFKWLIIKKLSLCGHGGIGRRARFRFWWVSRAGSSPVARTRLSLDAIRVPGSAFSFAFSLAPAAGSDLVTSTGGELPLPNRELHLCGVRGFFLPAFPVGIYFAQLWWSSTKGLNCLTTKPALLDE